MGFFDNVKLDLDTPLPEFEPTTTINQVNAEWQTKDIKDPCMDTYVIRDNRLYKICHEWEETPMGERVNVAGTNAPLVRPKKTWEEDTEFHGKFIFYTMIEEPGNTGKDLWYEYQAKFTDGELINIRIVAKNSAYSRRKVILPDEK